MAQRHDADEAMAGGKLRRGGAPRKGTRAVWSGEEEPGWEHAIEVPVVRSVGYAWDDLDEWIDVSLGRKPGHIYSRNTNPTVAAFEAKLRDLEDAEAATSFATGMAAISDTLFTLLGPGSRVVSINDAYGGTSRLFLEHLPRLGVDVALCETTDAAAIERELAAGADVLYLESPTNPLLKLLDIERLAAAAHAAGAVVVVDNTFASPLNQSPLTLGADLVVHSATKYLCGHGDALGGVVCGGAELVERVFRRREITGATLSADAAYLILRGMKTLHLRIRQHNENALAIAQMLEGLDGIAGVHYPGLPSHPQHALARRQMRGFGGMLSFELEGGFDAVRRFLPELRFAHRSASLGHVHTLVGPPATTSHVECTPEQRAALGIPEALVRYSVGIEDVEDLMEDLRQAVAVAVRQEVVAG